MDKVVLLTQLELIIRDCRDDNITNFKNDFICGLDDLIGYLNDEE